MKIAYVTLYDPSDLRNWSGLGRFIARALRGPGIQLDYVGPLATQRSVLSKARQLYCERVRKKRHLRGRERWQLKNYAQQVQQRLASLRPDVVFSPGTIPVALLKCPQPIVVWADATFASLSGSYPGYANLCIDCAREGEAADRAALEGCHLAIYTSEWAAQSATRDYGTDARKLRIVPFGPNLDSPPTITEVQHFVAHRSTSVCKLLLIGVDWYRKGADLAVATAEVLNERGMHTELTIIGCDPPDTAALPASVRCLGYIDKNERRGADRIAHELAQAHFLLLPSRAECYGLVVPEANSYGVPCVTTDVGGIPATMRDGANGASFPVSSYLEQAAAYIAEVFGDAVQYRALALSAFGQYESRLNWRLAGDQVRQLLASL